MNYRNVNQRNINQRNINQRKPSVTSVAQVKSFINLRLLLGVVLIAASFVSAFIISSSTNRMVTVWSATIDMPIGSIIDEQDIEQTQVTMPNNISMYLDGKASIVGSYVVRGVGAAELIPAYAISKTPVSNLRKVPLSIPAVRLPYQIKTGDLVDVYATPKQQLGNGLDSRTMKPGLIISQTAIDGINLESSKLGGEVGITLLVPQESVAKFINALATSEFVLVKSP